MPADDADPAASETPSVARIYDRLVGGAHNFRADRDLADEVSRLFPEAQAWTWANRAFLRHAVEHALGAGLLQFLDLGSGIPAAGGVHEIAHRQHPEARVAYVDHEPVAVARTRAAIEGLDTVGVAEADLRDPEAVLGAPEVRDLLDHGRPVALIMAASLHCVPDRAGPASILRRYRDALAPGSLLALSHTSSDLPDAPDLARRHRRVLELYADTDAPLHGRSRAAIRGLVEDAGFVVDGSGLVELGHWRAQPPHDAPVGGYALITEPLP